MFILNFDPKTRNPNTIMIKHAMRMLNIKLVHSALTRLYGVLRVPQSSSGRFASCCVLCAPKSTSFDVLTATQRHPLRLYRLLVAVEKQQGREHVTSLLATYGGSQQFQNIANTCIFSYVAKIGHIE